MTFCVLQQLRSEAVIGGVTDRSIGANSHPDKLNVKSGSPLTLYFGFDIVFF